MAVAMASQAMINDDEKITDARVTPLQLALHGEYTDLLSAMSRHMKHSLPLAIAYGGGDEKKTKLAHVTHFSIDQLLAHPQTKNLPIVRAVARKEWALFNCMVSGESTYSHTVSLF
jgi:hypothetical protein